MFFSQPKPQHYGRKWLLLYRLDKYLQAKGKQPFCKRWHLTLQYATFYRPKHGKSEGKRRPFARRLSNILIIRDL